MAGRTKGESSSLYGAPTEQAVFIRRPNRFVVECRLKRRRVEAYLPNPGRLWELLLPGAVLHLRRNRGEVSLPYTAMAVEKEGIPVLLHTHFANDIVEDLIRRKMIPGFEERDVVQREVRHGSSRFDFLLSGRTRRLVLEVKTCTLFSRTLAMFPDAITDRGSRHVTELAELGAHGFDSAVLFVIQWPFSRFFMPEYHTDLVFSENLLAARKTIEVKAVALQWEKDYARPAGVKELHIPWDLVEREARDEGSYMVIFRVDEKMRLKVGELGEVLFRKGYYVYTGSARRNLTRRVQRHQGKRRKLFWHIDYLAQKATFVRAAAVRSSADLECDIASALAGIADWRVRGFGSSDCLCEGHLFGMRENPLSSARFIGLLMHYRMGRLEQELEGGAAVSIEAPAVL
jgi:sugar fermentation stimulation protein A